MRVLKRESVMDHRRIEERSLALHREIAAKIQQNPSLLMEVRQRLEKAVESERYSESVKDALREWVGILDQKPVNEILELLTDPGEEAMRLRQSSPFAGILSEAERRRVFNRFYESARV
jgi:uncharacterized NAD(P)/FAD-binding protein YdhS